MCQRYYLTHVMWPPPRATILKLANRWRPARPPHPAAQCTPDAAAEPQNGVAADRGTRNRGSSERAAFAVWHTTGSGGRRVRGPPLQHNVDASRRRRREAEYRRDNKQKKENRKPAITRDTQGQKMKTIAIRSVYHPARYATQRGDQGMRMTHSRTTPRSSRRQTPQQP